MCKTINSKMFTVLSSKGVPNITPNMTSKSHFKHAYSHNYNNTFQNIISQMIIIKNSNLLYIYKF